MPYSHHMPCILRAVILVSAALCAFCADPNTAPTVAYTATGTFATPPIHGYDKLGLAGQPFSITILASEGLKPTRRTKTSARYDNVPLSGSIASAYTYGVPLPILVNASIILQVGAAGAPDEMKLSFQANFIDVPLQVAAEATMPAGTITSPAIAPFNTPVTLTLTNATARYAGSESTTLGMTGTLNGAVQPPPSVDVLYNFTGSLYTGPDGGGPMSGLIEGPDGAFYGTTRYGGAGFGTVFKLTQPSSPGGAWAETVLYTFPNPFSGDGTDGAYPASPLVLAPDGSLCGATAGGGGYCISTFGCGTVFSLTPPSPPATTWNETVLYRFTGGPDGVQPNGLVMTGGTLYGTAAFSQVKPPCPFGNGCGTIFELAPPTASGGAWQFTVLHAFTSEHGDGDEPLAGLTVGPGGTFYGTTAGGGTIGYGTVFQLSPPATPGGPWTETVLYNFGASTDGNAPEAPVIIGPNGELYGSTYGGGSTACIQGCGTVFRLTPHGNTWAESILYRFQDTPTDGYYPTGGVLLGKNGALYGAVLGGPSNAGSIFKLNPPASDGAAWNLTLLASFNLFDGNVSFGGLTFDSSGALLGTTQTGGTPGCVVPIYAYDFPFGCGTSFRLIP